LMLVLIGLADKFRQRPDFAVSKIAPHRRELGILSSGFPDSMEQLT